MEQGFFVPWGARTFVDPMYEVVRCLKKKGVRSRVAVAPRDASVTRRQPWHCSGTCLR